VADALSCKGQVNNVASYLMPQELCWEMEQLNLGMLNCKENGPRAIWLNEFWCLMINTICELMCLLVFVVHMMLK
jgi:hypothetical protein